MYAYSKRSQNRDTVNCLIRLGNEERFKMVPMQRIVAKGCFQDIGVFLSRLSNGPGSFLPRGANQGYGFRHSEMILIFPRPKCEKNKQRGAGQ